MTKENICRQFQLCARQNQRTSTNYSLKKYNLGTDELPYLDCKAAMFVQTTSQKNILARQDLTEVFLGFLWEVDDSNRKFSYNSIFFNYIFKE